MTLKKLIFMSVFLAQIASVSAQELVVSDEERLLLGIDVQTLVVNQQGPSGELTLRAGFAPDAEWLIKTPFSGILQSIFVQEGDRIAAGDVLVGIRSSEVVDLQRDFLQARAEMKLQKATWLRDEKLKEAGSLSSRRWQETQYAHDMSRAALAGLRAQLVLAGFSDSDLERLSSDMAISPDFMLRAPADALVVDLPAILGDYLSGDELLIRLGQPNELILEGVLSSSAAGQLHEGALLSHRDNQAKARLVFVSTVVDSASQTVHIRAIPVGSPDLYPGLLSRWFVLSEAALLTVPSNAVVRLSGEDVVYVRTDAGFTARKVTVSSTGSGWLVMEGLEAGEQIAISGTAALKGMSIGMGGGEG